MRLRAEKRQRFHYRECIRALRARKRTEKLVRNICAEQYRAAKSGKPLDSRPFIFEAGNPSTDLYLPIPVQSMKPPIDNCTICQYPLDETQESGVPMAMPCGHMLHEQCLNQFFAKRIESKERDVYKCVLCNIILRDIRRIPDFYARYIEKEREFEADAESSEISESDGESYTSGKVQTKDSKPPWPMELSVDDQGDEGRAKMHWLNWRHGIPHSSDAAHNSRYVINATFQIASGGILHEVLVAFIDRTMETDQLESNLLDHLLLFLGSEEGNNEYDDEIHDEANGNSNLLDNEALLPRDFNRTARRSPSVEGELEEAADEPFFFRPPEPILQSTDIEDHEMDQPTHILWTKEMRHFVEAQG